MALILHLETSTLVCSVALARSGTLVAVKELHEESYSHAENLTIFIEQLLKDEGFTPTDLDAVAVSGGPGSYTGLRIGCSTAKGLCYGLEIPLISIDSLQALAALSNAKQDLICPMFDARRMEVYTALYTPTLSVEEEVSAVLLEEYKYEDVLTNKSICFLGPGAVKAEEVIKNENAYFDLETEVSSRGMIELAWAKFQQLDFADVAYYEPFYLKDFIAGKPKKLL